MENCVYAYSNLLGIPGEKEIDREHDILAHNFRRSLCIIPLRLTRVKMAR